MSLTDRVSQMAKKREQLYADYVAGVVDSEDYQLIREDYSRQYDSLRTELQEAENKKVQVEQQIKSKTVLRLRQKTSAFPFPPTRAFSGWNAGRNLLKVRNQIENPNLNRNSKKRSIGLSIFLKKAI